MRELVVQARVDGLSVKPTASRTQQIAGHGSDGH